MEISSQHTPSPIHRMDKLTMGADDRLKFITDNEIAVSLPELVGKITTPEVSIAAKKYSRFNLLHLFLIIFRKSVVVNHQGTNILINLNSIKNNTFASNEQIKEAINDEKLIEFITLSIAIKRFEENEEQPYLLDVIHSKRFINITKNLSVENLPSAQLLIGLNEKGEIDLLRVGQTLAKGTFGKVVEIENLTEGKREVIKNGRKRKGLAAVRDVENEYHKEQQIFKGKKVWGFRDPTMQLTTMPVLTKKAKAHDNDVSPNETRNKVVSRNHRYDNNYFEDIGANPGRTFETLLPDFYQMFYALHYMKLMGITHSDIKPQNILITTVDGVRLVHLTDFGDMVCYGDLEPNERITATAFGTPEYSLRHEMEESVNQLFKNNQKRSVIEEIQNKRDVFAMGATIYAALNQGNLPYQLSEDGYPVEPDEYVNISGIPDSFNALLKKMLCFNRSERLGVEQVWEEFSQIIREFPEIHQQILADIAKLGYDETEIF